MKYTTTSEVLNLKSQLQNLSFESELTATIKADTIGELMDACIDNNSKLIKPFEESENQNYYYFVVNVRPDIIIKVVSSAKVYKTI